MITLLSVLVACNAFSDPIGGRPPPADSPVDTDAPIAEEPPVEAPVEPCPFDMSRTQILFGPPFRQLALADGDDLAVSWAASPDLHLRPNELPTYDLDYQVWVVDGSATTENGMTILQSKPITGIVTSDRRFVRGTDTFSSTESSFASMPMSRDFLIPSGQPPLSICSCDLTLTLNLRMYPVDHPQCVLEGAWTDLRMTINGRLADGGRVPGLSSPCEVIAAPPGFPGATTDHANACNAWLPGAPPPPPPVPVDTAGP